MNLNQKQALIAEIVTLLQAKLEVDIKAEAAERAIQTAVIPAKLDNSAVEMLTIKECCGVIKGLSEHSLRQLVAQKKIPFIRTGQGKRGKILINRNVLMRYFNNLSAEGRAV
ncbi:MAG: DNA-binding protein [Oscillospiraceae bacterium]|nr:DNA-binding protein [Oscillospiraceae bacterium]